MNPKWLYGVALIVFWPGIASAQVPVPDSTTVVWSSLSAPAMDPAKLAQVENISIDRDRVHITLASGTIQFSQPVNGVVFGATFHGKGRLQADPPNAIEGQQLRLFTKQDKLDMTFTDATFSFTDGLFDEVSKQVRWIGGGPTADETYNKRQQEREDLGAEYLPRLFKSVMSPDRGRTAYFLGDFKTKEKGWVEVRDDAMQPEEIRIGRWADAGIVKDRDYWMMFPAGNRDPRHAYDDPAAREDFLISSYDIHAHVEENAELEVNSRVTVQPRYSGERVLLLSLDSNLRVSSVSDAKGRALDFYQARMQKDRPQSYGNYLVAVLKDAGQAGSPEQLAIKSAGKRIVFKVGDGNYFCRSFGWYPTEFSNEPGVETFAFRSDFDLTFESPKKYTLVATGNKIGESIEGKYKITKWKSDIPLAVAGFVFGDYKLTTDKAGDTQVEVYTNNQPDDLLKRIQLNFDNPLGDLQRGPAGTGQLGRPEAAIGNLSASALGKTIGIETANTLRLFDSYFGPYPYKQLVVTNIIGSYGQGWPGLLYLGWFTFLDSTQRNALGIKNQVNVTDFFRGHESSHQWWGHRVGWKSFHDQWLSEGFAEFSGKLYVQFRQNPKEALTQFRNDKQLLRNHDIHNHEIDSLGPIWMGRRIFSSETGGGSYQDLIYSKGGYILQMLRMQLTDPQNADPDRLFKDMMQDYCKTFENKGASTEDFKAIVEKHMTRSMDVTHNHKMDWFFDQYVYGTGMAQYNLHVSSTATPDGKTVINGELLRAGVPDNWIDLVPIYAHFGEKTVRLGLLQATHPVEKINVTIPAKIDHVSINDYEDLLAEVK